MTRLRHYDDLGTARFVTVITIPSNEDWWRLRVNGAGPVGDVIMVLKMFLWSWMLMNGVQQSYLTEPIARRLSQKIRKAGNHVCERK